MLSQPEFTLWALEIHSGQFHCQNYIKTTLGNSLGPNTWSARTEAASPEAWGVWAWNHQHRCCQNLGVAVLNVTSLSPVQSLHLSISSFEFRSEVGVWSYTLGEGWESEALAFAYVEGGSLKDYFYQKIFKCWMVRNDKCLTGTNEKYHTVTTTSKKLHQERIERDWIHTLGDFFSFFP